MSIATEITRLQNAKSALATSIGNKGVIVPSATKLDGYAALVDSIQTGGSGEWTTDGIADKSEPSGEINISVAVKDRTFSSCNNITKVTLTYNGSCAGSYSFEYCTGLQEVICTRGQVVGTRAFQGCTNLRKVTMSGSNFSMGNNIFNGCSSLETVDCGSPSGWYVQTFNGCSALKNLILRNTSVQDLNQTPSAAQLGGIYSNPSQAAIYVPTALINDYKVATNWSALYALNNNIFKAIEGSEYEL